MVTPQVVISYLNRWVNIARDAGQPTLYFPYFSSRNVTTTGIQGSGQHEFQGRYGDPIKAAMGVLNAALVGTPRQIEKFRNQYADWEGPGKPPEWLDQVTADLTAMGAFAGTSTPPPPVVTPPPPVPPPPPPATTLLEARLLAIEARLHALDGK